jgi:hypothetical protein
MVSSGHPAKIYLEKAFTHVQMRQGSIGIKVSQTSSGCSLPRRVAPQPHSITAGVHHVAARPDWSQRRQDAPARLHQDQRAPCFQEGLSALCSSRFAVKLAGSSLPYALRSEAPPHLHADALLLHRSLWMGSGWRRRRAHWYTVAVPFIQLQRNTSLQRCHHFCAHHVRPSACARENKKRSRAAFGMVAARACNARERARSKSAAAARQSPPASRCHRPQCRGASAAHRASWRAPPALRQHFTRGTGCAKAVARAHLDHRLIRATRLHERNRRCETKSVSGSRHAEHGSLARCHVFVHRCHAEVRLRRGMHVNASRHSRGASFSMRWVLLSPWRARSQPPSLPRSSPPARRTCKASSIKRTGCTFAAAAAPIARAHTAQACRVWPHR